MFDISIRDVFRLGKIQGIEAIDLQDHIGLRGE